MRVALRAELEGFGVEAGGRLPAAEGSGPVAGVAQGGQGAPGQPGRLGPGGAGERQGGPVVVGEQLGPALGPVGGQPLDPGGRPAVLVGPLGPQHLPVGHVPDQGVAERVLDLARHPRDGRALEELAGLEAGQGGFQVGEAPAGDLGQRAQPADLAEHGRVVEHRLVGGGERVQAGGHDGVHPGGQGDGGAPVGGGPAAAVAQHPHVLLGEQGVAADPAEQGGVDLGGQAVVGQEGGQQAGGVGVAEGAEPDGGPAGAPAGPALQQLGPGRGQDQDGRRPGVRLDQALDEVEQGVVGPVQVLEGQHQRPGGGQAVQEPPPGGELLLAVGGGGRPGGPGPGAEADQAAQVAGHPGGGDRIGHRRRGRGQAPAGELGAVALEDAGLGLDRLGERPEGRAVAVR